MLKSFLGKIARPFADYTVIFFGNILFASSVAFFSKPLEIPMGGVSGIAQIINYLSSLPLGVMIIVLNIPLFLISFRSLGKRFLIRTVFATVSSSLLVDLIERLIGDYKFTENHLLAALYAGVLAGAGLGLVFTRGSTTGGSDILSKMLNKKAPHISLGRINLVINTVVIVIAAIVFGRIEAALYAIVAQYVSGTMIDAIVKGLDNSAVALIVTNDAHAISNVIFSELGRGCTGLDSRGMYTDNEHLTLMVVVRSHEIANLKLLIKKTDPNSFMVLLNAHDVFGRGFKTIEN